ncbi:bacterioferritin-associated ferredoxin, partial [Klebsiella pneumoniae]|nr:bacterioferritin-associated ferredoxin [Klebsiella pneumoniae]
IKCGKCGRAARDVVEDELTTKPDFKENA